MKTLHKTIAACLIAAVALVQFAHAQDAKEPAPFKKEQIEQLVAPIALYPDAADCADSDGVDLPA
jgi:hypothetical protein